MWVKGVNFVVVTDSSDGVRRARDRDDDTDSERGARRDEETITLIDIFVCWIWEKFTLVRPQSGQRGADC